MSERPLHVQVAEALGWTELALKESFGAFEMIELGLWQGVPHGRMGELLRIRLERGQTSRFWPIPRYDTDWSVTGPLIVKYVASLHHHPAGWTAVAHGQDISFQGGLPSGPLVVVCKLILLLSKEGKL